MNKKHWDNIYDTKSSDQVSWAQEVPKTSLDFIRSFRLPKTANIIDIGGGDSNLVDYLLEEGYKNISVLDISSSALAKSKKRLGDKAKNVTWIVSDISEFEPDKNYDLWHDRAAFHFLTTADRISKYLTLVNKHVNGYLIIGTFSKEGPEKCSGLDIKQYSEVGLTKEFEEGFENILCVKEDHITPQNAQQNFLYCSFRKL